VVARDQSSTAQVRPSTTARCKGKRRGRGSILVVAGEREALERGVPRLP
jgi:hypothetical protein